MVPQVYIVRVPLLTHIFTRNQQSQRLIVPRLRPAHIFLIHSPVPRSAIPLLDLRNHHLNEELLCVLPATLLLIQLDGVLFGNPDDGLGGETARRHSQKRCDHDDDGGIEHTCH